MSLGKSVDSLLKTMHQHRSVDKGTFGEKAVFKICEQFYQREGGILIHSYTYKSDPNLEGNVKKDANGKLYIENVGSRTEIDIMYISKYKVFPIEVKAYKVSGSKQIIMKDDGIYGCYKTDKSPVHQNEMHCRHLYPYLFRGLPNGDTRYIVPVVCMVDEACIVDERSDWQKSYIKLCILNTLENVIRQNNNPLEYQLNLKLMDKLLKEAMISSEKYLPPRL